MEELSAWRKDLKSEMNYQPLLVALEALLLKLLHCNNHSWPGPRGREGILIDPPFEDVTKPTFAHEAVRAEVPRRAP